MNYYITIEALYRYPISLDFPMKSYEILHLNMFSPLFLF